MNKSKFAILIVILTALFFSYYLLKQFHNVDECTEVGGSWNKKTKYCDINPVKNAINHLWSVRTEGLVIMVPGVDATAILGETVSLRGGYYVKGDYVVKSNSKNIEKGSIFFNSHKVTRISKINSAKLLSYYVAPFFVSNQGSGVFAYLGLFSYDEKLNKSHHLDSAFLGDRVKSIKIVDEVYAVKVTYLIHGEKQYFADEPRQKKVLLLMIDGEKSSLILYKKNHPSWDKNKDGLNDCEDDGTCDHSIDYSQPKIDQK